MNTITDLYRQRRAASVAHCAPPEMSCSTCGMLECVCRPRFFSGQVLTADDLNRLDAYIRAKHRLHNRQLHGFGVVNGLEVTCAPCGDGVTVSCGYALSPCGEDIVVCDSVEVDACALIQDCERPVPRCDPPRPAGAGTCPEGEEEWLLAIRYAESPTRGIRPLYDSQPCGCGKGGCGGKASGCGCGGKSALKCTCSPKPRGAPVQCEPTVICEGYAFEMVRKPAVSSHDDDTSARNPALQNRLKCCIEGLTKGAPAMPNQPINTQPAAWHLWALRFQQHLLARLREQPGVNCVLLDRIGSLAIPPGTTNGTAAAAAAAAAAKVANPATLRLNPALDDPAALQGFSRSLMQSLFTPGGTITPELLAEGLLSGQGNLPLTAGALPQWLLTNQLGRPIARVLGGEMLSVLGGGRDTAAGPSHEADADDAPALHAAVAALAARIDAQDAEIAGLRKSLARKPRGG